MLFQTSYERKTLLHLPSSQVVANAWAPESEHYQLREVPAPSPVHAQVSVAFAGVGAKLVIHCKETSVTASWCLGSRGRCASRSSAILLLQRKLIIFLGSVFA